MSSFKASITIKLSKYPKINIAIFARQFYISVPSLNSTITKFKNYKDIIS